MPRDQAEVCDAGSAAAKVIRPEASGIRGASEMTARLFARK